MFKTKRILISIDKDEEGIGSIYEIEVYKELHYQDGDGEFGPKIDFYGGWYFIDTSGELYSVLDYKEYKDLYYLRWFRKSYWENKLNGLFLVLKKFWRNI